MTDKQIIIEDCPHFIGGCCQEYLDGVCENHKCDLKIIRELEQQLKAKEQECEELKRYKSLFEKARDLWNEASKTNYKLLDEIEDLKDSLKKTICQSECYRYKEAEKLKQTLTEIKDFFKEECLICKENYINIIGEICKECKYQDILRKINEVE